MIFLESDDFIHMMSTPKLILLRYTKMVIIIFISKLKIKS